MFMHNGTKEGGQGFTLIELLVVIAIIGILSSVVLAALSTARGKGHDAKVKSQLSGLRAAAEIYYESNHHYGSAVSDDCATSDFFSDADSKIVAYTTQDNYPTGATLSCHTDGSAYAVSALLVSSTTAAWCVDNTGTSRSIPSNLSNGQVSCP